MGDRAAYPPRARIEIDLVDEAPAPVLVGFERSDDRMPVVAGVL